MNKNLRRIRVGFRIESVERLSLQRTGNNSQIVINESPQRSCDYRYRKICIFWIREFVIFSVCLNEITGKFINQE